MQSGECKQIRKIIHGRKRSVETTQDLIWNFNDRLIEKARHNFQSI